ncbi:MAG: aldehyde ferredoxin oxidoreductase family protein [Dethiobacteria bacterium]|nr:aldehyde ferredoxin oxidoreductase family protein [Bacillota bacterium]
MFKGAYMGKLLRIDLTSRSCKEEAIPVDYYKKYLGGRGLGACYYYQELTADVDPLSPENKIFIFTSPLTGLPLPSTTKFQLATRSPETGIYLCTNSSGFVGPYLKRNGFDGIIVEGRADEPVYLFIKQGQVEFKNASHLVSLSTGETEKAIQEEIGNKRAAVMMAGPAAFVGVRVANVMVGDRSFGRGGAGLVMASKNLKAIAVDNEGEIPVFDLQKLKEINREAVRKAHETRKGHTLYGTNQYTEILNELGCYSVKNFTTGVFDGVETISKDYVTNHFKVKSKACFRCPVACAQVCEVKEGPFKGMVVDPEYETVGLLGALCGVSDFAAIIAANRLCDDYGIDTMSVGNIIAYAMECYERGIFTDEDTGGLKLTFGNGEAMVELIRQIGEGEGFGAVLGSGFRGLAYRFPHTARYMMHVKWMPFAAYEPRGFYGMGLAYGTSSRGACHNVGGWTIRDELISKTYDRFALEGKGELVKRIQDTRAYIDSLGICTVVRSTMGFHDNPQGEAFVAATGVDMTPELMKIGERIYALERLILVREGIRRCDDYLPLRTMEEPLPEGPAKGSVLTKKMYDVMLDEYYRLRRWDENGIPTPEGLKEMEVLP